METCDRNARRAMIWCLIPPYVLLTLIIAYFLAMVFERYSRSYYGLDATLVLLTSMVICPACIVCGIVSMHYVNNGSVKKWVRVLSVIEIVTGTILSVPCIMFLFLWFLS